VAGDSFRDKWGTSQEIRNLLERVLRDLNFNPRNNGKGKSRIFLYGTPVNFGGNTTPD